MQENYSLQEWRSDRLKNYCAKLQMSKKKGLKRLMLFTDPQRLTNEFDRICDSKFWSNNEPGISYIERKKRLTAMHKQCAPNATQLSLFNNKNYNHGNFDQSFRLQRTTNRLR